MPDQFSVNPAQPVLRLLGPPRIEGPDGAVAAALTQRHRLALLALLALAPNHVLRRDRLVGLLWPETGATKARHLLNVAAHAIRKVLGESALISEGDALRLDPSTVRVDVLAFERLARSGDATAAVDMYTGAFLEGLALPRAVEFERWQEDEAERLKQLFQSALENLAHRTVRERGVLAGLPLWQRRVACSPEDGRVVVQFMRLLAQAGDRAGALRVAAEHADLLKSEFGVGPDSAVERDAAALKRSPSMATAEQMVDVLASCPPVPVGPDAPILEPGAPRRRRTRAVIAIVGGALAIAGAMWAAGRLQPAPATPTASSGEEGTSEARARAHEAWLRARSHLQRRTPTDLDACLREANLAITIDPTYASGHAVKGACLLVSTSFGMFSPADGFPRIEQEARRAHALERSHAGAHVLLAWVRTYQWDWTAAEPHFRQAIQLNPGFDYARADYGYFLACLRRYDQALAEASEAERLSPTVPFVTQNVAIILYVARRYDESIAHAQHTISLDSSYFLGYERLALGYAAKGRYAEAALALEKAVRLAPGYARLLGFLGYVYGRAGRLADAQSLLNTLRSMDRHSYIPPTAIAMVLVGLDDNEGALAWLERGYERRDADMVLLESWPPWDPVRSEPRFQRLVRRMNFPEPRP